MRQHCFAAALAFTAATRCLTAQADTPSRGVIRGIVLDTLGRPYPGVVVHVLRRSIHVSTIGDTTRSVVDMWSDTTDASGRFEFTSLGPRVYSLAFHQSFLVSGYADSVDLKGPTDTVSVELRSTVRHRVFETPDSVRTRRLAELAEARERWAAHRVLRYSLVAEIDCFCLVFGAGKATTFEYRNDSLVRLNGQRVRRPIDGSPYFKSFSVPSLFKEVEEAIRNLDRIVEAVEYDATYGVPTRLDTNTAYGFTDSWFRWRVKEFRPR